MKLFWILILFLVGWDLFWWALGARPISPWSLKRSLADGGKNRPLLIDVRTPAEFSAFHIREAESHPTVLTDSNALGSLSKEKPVIVVCLSGHRSALAAFRLKQEGYQDVSYLTWGMLAWIVSGGETVRGRQ